MADRAEPEDPQGRAANAIATAESVRVFVSYASQDAAVAASIIEHLEGHGVRCWMAPRDVKPGTVYADAIVRAINDANALVLVLSANAMASAHVGREVERAASKRKQLIAFRTDATPLTPELEYFLSNCQWIDVPALGMAAALVKLEKAVGSAPALTTDARIAAASSAGGRSRLAIIAAAVVVAACVAAAVGMHHWQSKPRSAPSPTAAPIADKSIAVLPFVDMSEKHDQEYFADGIAEEVLDGLAKVPGLKVVGRTSSFQFRDKNASPASIGAALRVVYLLEGSVRKQAGRVRVTAELVEAQTGSQRWSDHFDSDLVEVLGVQDTIAAEIARALQIAVEVDKATRSAIKSPEALEAYLRGLYSSDRSTREGSEAAVVHFQQALALDPTLAPAATGLAEAYLTLGSEGWLPTNVAFERAREAALLAQRLDPKSPAPHVSMASIHIIYDWDWAAADLELQRAFALGARGTVGVVTASELAAARGEWDGARQLAIEAVEIDPLDGGRSYDPRMECLSAYGSARRGGTVVSPRAANRAAVWLWSVFPGPGADASGEIRGCAGRISKGNVGRRPARGLRDGSLRRGTQERVRCGTGRSCSP